MHDALNPDGPQIVSARRGHYVTRVRAGTGYFYFYTFTRRGMRRVVVRHFARCASEARRAATLWSTHPAGRGKA